VAASAAGVALRPHRALARTAPPAIVKPIPADAFRVLGTNLETLFEAFKGRGYRTPASLFLVRNHTRTPSIDVTTWRLILERTGVRRPLSLGYEDLFRFRPVTSTNAIECAGNGRSFFISQQGTPAAGSHWRLGAIEVPPFPWTA
jgi:sulfane dehydrogenase subunit SoxC